MRELDPDEYSRTWYRQDPPWPQVEWSQRNNNNYEQTGLLVSLAFAADNREQLLRNFYAEEQALDREAAARRAGGVRPAGRRRAAPSAQARAAARAAAPARRDPARSTAPLHRPPRGPRSRREARTSDADEGDGATATAEAEARAGARTFAAGSYVVRMDQPYSRIADALLDRQYWSPDDPQKHPYDDTGWSFGELFDVEALRVVDAKVLDAAMSPSRTGARRRRRHRQRTGLPRRRTAAPTRC